MNEVAPCCYLIWELAVTPLFYLKVGTFRPNDVPSLFSPIVVHMGSSHGPHNQVPSWGYRRDTPTLPSPTGVPNVPSASQMLNPSCPTNIYFPTPPTQPCRPPRVSPQRYIPPGPHAHSASHCQQLDAGAFPSSSSGCYALPPRSQNTPHIPSAPKFVSGLLSVLVSSSSVSPPSTTGLRSLFSL